MHQPENSRRQDIEQGDWHGLSNKSVSPKKPRQMDLLYLNKSMRDVRPDSMGDPELDSGLDKSAVKDIWGDIGDL